MTRSVNVSTFKSRCLALLDDVASSGAELVVTKRGKALARVVPIQPPDSLRSSVSYEKERDLLEPVDSKWWAES